MRSAALEERDRWKIEQQWYIDHLLQPIFDEWLDMFLLSDKTILPYSKKWKFQNATWQPRSYQWVDPRKDAQANMLLMDKKIITPQSLISEQAQDPEDVLDQWTEWETMLTERNMVNNEQPKKDEQNGNA